MNDRQVVANACKICGKKFQLAFDRVQHEKLCKVGDQRGGQNATGVQ